MRWERRRGSGLGTAESSASVYGCRGVAKSAFAGIGPTGPINPGLIEYNVAAATQSDTRFFFTPFGAFFYDSNGSAGGGQVQIGQFQGIVPSTDAILIY